MMNDDMMRNIEYLREKADISYEEAVSLLERFDGNVMRVLVELERQGRVFQQAETGLNSKPEGKAYANKSDGRSFLEKALQHRLVVESGSGDKKATVANLSAPFCAGAALLAPHVAIGSVALMFVMGYRVRIEKKPFGKLPEDPQEFVDRAVSNIKKTASSLSETARDLGSDKHNDSDNDDDDEGGEITIE